MTLTRLMYIAAVAVAPIAAAQSLDYETFKTKVQPIFMKKRPTHARCIVCHQTPGRAFHLEAFSAGATTWNEEQTRKNFETVSKLVKPGDPMASLLCKQPLDPAAGGNDFHSGGHQFANQNDPDWKTIADWVKAAK
jgi:hypothetical protein